MHIAFFGGSFNPPHLGHRQVVEYLCTLPQFDEVWMAPTFSHAFLKEVVSFEDRLRMCKLTLSGLNPKAKVCPIEGELKQTPSYTIDVLSTLKKRCPFATFSIVVGSDCKKDLPQWKNYQELMKIAQFYFIPRGGFETSPFLNISSTEIRALISAGKPYHHYLTAEVVQYIEKNKHY